MRIKSFTWLLLLFRGLFLFVSPASALTSSASSLVSGSIPSTTLTIYGYAGPLSHVHLNGIKTFAVTQSDPTGYFVFDTIQVPRPVEELCLSTLDAQNRESNAVCIPPPPAFNYTTSTGPIIIPPIISLDKAAIKPGETIITSGATIPNATVKIYFFQQDNRAINFPSQVQAFSLPSLTVQSDAQGNFTFNLPTAAATNFRFYAATLFQQDQQSPKSNTLFFTLPSLTFLFWQKYAFYILLIPIFLVTVSFFIWLTIRYYHQPRFLPAVYIKTIWLPSSFRSIHKS